jgi:drug/metabolite transporter (DMT)-like permease
MKLSLWFTLGAIVFGVFGIALLAAPNWMSTTYEINLNEGGILLASLLGAAFVFAAVVSWAARNSPETEPAVRGVVVASFLGDTMGFIYSLIATLNGTMNSLGWINVGLYGLFAVVFAYFLVTRYIAKTRPGIIRT